jgi:photosystem II stability/assembly factor-like uncharacterized protein
MAKPLLASEGSVWVQPGGPNTPVYYLGCHEVGDVEESLGDMTRLYCPSNKVAGAFEVVGSYRGEPDAPTFSITTDLYKTADWMEKLVCPATFFIHKMDCGRPDSFSNYARSFIFPNASITKRGVSNLRVREPGDNDRSEQTYDITAEAQLHAFSLIASSQSVAAVRDILALVYFNDIQCAGACGPTQLSGEAGVAVGAGDYAAKAVQYWTADGGATWTVGAADPFAVAEDISSVVAFTVGASTKRVLVARGTADGANPAEVAYSDDLGATWHLVNVGSTNGQYVTKPQGMFALDQFNVYLTTSDGYIYKSEDGGLTWVAQETGTLAATGWNAIAFLDDLTGWVAGPGNEIATTADGGLSWTAVSGPAAQAAVAVNALSIVDQYIIWLGYADGDLYYSMDGGLHWTKRTIPVAATTIKAVQFVNELVGFAVYETSAPVGGLLRTIDGGYTWETVPLPTNVGLNALAVLGVNDAILAGDVSGATAVIFKVFA